MPAVAFGRRAPSSPKAPALPARARSEYIAETKTPEPLSFEDTAAPMADMPSLDDELREWKRNRKSGFQIPWRQVSLMASLFFGIASFVLPDTTNDAVNWLLYGLMAVSFIAGISRRRKRADLRNTATG